MTIYPITTGELDAAAKALSDTIDGGGSLTSCVHAVLGAIEAQRRDPLPESGVIEGWFYP